jgi:hypothetical protein
MRITVKPLQGLPFPLDIDARSTVEQLRIAIHTKVQKPLPPFKLTKPICRIVGVALITSHPKKTREGGEIVVAGGCLLVRTCQVLNRPSPPPT